MRLAYRHLHAFGSLMTYHRLWRVFAYNLFCNIIYPSSHRYFLGLYFIPLRVEAASRFTKSATPRYFNRGVHLPVLNRLSFSYCRLENTTVDNCEDVGKNIEIPELDTSTILMSGTTNPPLRLMK